MVYTLISVTLPLAAALLSPLSSEQLYLDPGSGSFLLQLIIASALGALFILKTYWGKIKSISRRIFSAPDKKQNDER